MSTRRSWIASAALVALAVPACQPAAPAALSDADKAAIAQTMNDALAIGNQQPVDWNAYVQAYYTSDAIVMPPNSEAVQGHEALVAMFGMYPPLSDVRFVQREVDGVGGWAWVYGTYSFNMTLPDVPTAVPDSGKFVEIWKKQADGSWRVYRDIFNTSLPAPTP